MKVSEQLRIRSKVNDSLQRLLTHLSSGRAYTLIELSKKTKTSKRKTREILKDLGTMEVVKTRKNRKRDYYFIPEPLKIDYIKTLAKNDKNTSKDPEGMKYSRHCYNHLAGYVGVQLTEALVSQNFIIPQRVNEDYGNYEITPAGWKWFSKLGIEKESFAQNGSRLTKQCLDFSERKSHLGGKLGDALLKKLIHKGWASETPNSREIQFTATGRKNMLAELGIEVVPHN